MSLGWFRAEQFRCLAEVEIELDPKANLFIGPNASGKTSLLEAVYFLSRGRSFRTRRRDALIRQGANAFLIAGRVDSDAGSLALGVRTERKESEWRVGGQSVESVARVAEEFPAQVIGPEIHKLLEEGPGRRRRFLDWGVFHVEPGFLSNWQRYHQALRQRNAALKLDAPDADIAVWEQDLARCGEELVRQRAVYVERLGARLETIGASLLGQPVGIVHSRGWHDGQSLLDALTASRVRDRRSRATQVGPHRGDVTAQINGRAAKDEVSRGQQKLLAAALMLAQLEVQEAERPGRSALLLDDPAAELDADSLGRLMTCVQRLSAQLWITSLRAEVLGIPAGTRVFHVKQGEIAAG